MADNIVGTVANKEETKTEKMKRNGIKSLGGQLCNSQWNLSGLMHKLLIQIVFLARFHSKNWRVEMLQICRFIWNHLENDSV